MVNSGSMSLNFSPRRPVGGYTSRVPKTLTRVPSASSSRLRRRIGVMVPLDACEQLDVEHRLAVRAFLNEREVGVGSPVDETGDLTDNPHSRSEAIAKGVVDRRGQFDDAIGRVAHEPITRGATRREARTSAPPTTTGH